MKLTRKKILHEAVELNITAFLNLMVILVPFLLITAVFSRLTVIELNLPQKNAVANQEEKIDLQLELVIRTDGLEVRDANLGRIKYFPAITEKSGWKTFSDSLLEIKRRFPDEDSITLLLDPNVDYKTLIAIMDRVRDMEVVVLTSVEVVELFPNVSIGDAPPRLDSEDTSSQNEVPK